MGCWQFGILGPLQVWRHEELVAVNAAKRRAVLALLLLRTNQVVTADQLIDVVWGEVPPRSARRTLQSLISRLRQSLAPCPDCPDAQPILLRRSSGYVLNVPPEQVDVHRFEELIALASDAVAEVRSERAARLLRQALGLWRGEVLADVPRTAAIEAEAVRLDERRLAAVQDRVEADLQLGRHTELLGELRALTAEQPLRERPWEQLMLALYRSGRQADALDSYQQVREILRDELGAEPGGELQRLHEAILNHDRKLDITPAPSPQATPSSTTPRELPADVGGFTGRAGALAALDGLLSEESPPRPLVISAITGTAGVGKTALAVHWAHRIADRFPDGQLYLDLRGFATGPPLRPVEALAALLRSLGTPPEQIPADEAQAAALYRSQVAGRRLLVVLDNASSAEQIRPLLPGSPGCLVVVTSRDRLAGLIARDGARRLTLDVLDDDEARTLLERLLGAERVRAESEAVAQLVQACAHLPLALRIAAANLLDHSSQTIATYVSELSTSDRLAALQADGDRESAVGLALELSYQRLPAPARRLFRLLGLVPGPNATPAAAAALADIARDEAKVLLDRLAAAHLIDESAADRYSFHDLLRLYAEHLADAEESADQRSEASGRLLRWYLQTAHVAADLIYPDLLRLPVPPAPVPPLELDQPSAALAWLDAEHANLVAAIQHASTEGPRPVAWLLADCLRGYFWYRRHDVDWLTVTNAALTAAERENNPQAQAAILLSLANLQRNVARYSESVSHYAAAQDLARQAGWIDGQAAALGNLGVVYQDLGQLSEAAGHYAQALALSRESGRLGGQATMSTNLGTIHHDLGRLQLAAEHHAQAQALYGRLGSVSGEAVALQNLGQTYRYLGRLDEARRCLSSAVDMHREVGLRPAEASALTNLAAVERDAGRLTDAIDHAEASAALAAEIDDRRIEVEALNVLGRVHLRLGHLEQALGYHLRALDLAHQTGASSVEAPLGLAATQRRLGHQEASQYAQQGLDLAREAGYRLLEGEALTVLAEIRCSQGEFGQAQEYGRQALDNHRETGYRLGEALTRAVFAQVLNTTGDAQTAEQHRRAALELFDDIGAPAPDDLRQPQTEVRIAS